MDIGSAFTFVFDDDDWIKKLAIGGGIAIGAFILLPVLFIGLILILPLQGYALQVLKNVRDENAPILPEWDDFGELSKAGLFVVVIWLIYHLPALIFTCASLLVRFAPQFVDINPDTQGFVTAIGACLICIQIFLNLGAFILFPAALIRYAQSDTIGSAFQFGEIFSFIRNDIGDYIIVVLLALVAGTIAVFGFMVCGIGIFFTAFWSILVKASLYGQLARKAQEAPEMV